VNDACRGLEPEFIAGSPQANREIKILPARSLELFVKSTNALKGIPGQCQ
jgi:hypothetical protein